MNRPNSQNDDEIEDDARMHAGFGAALALTEEAMTDTTAAPSRTVDDILSEFGFTRLNWESDPAMVVELINELDALRSESVQPQAWIATYTDSAGRHNQPLHLAAHDSDGGGWKVEVVLEKPNNAAPLPESHNRETSSPNEAGVAAPSARCVEVSMGLYKRILLAHQEASDALVDEHGDEHRAIVAELLAAAPVSPAPKTANESERLKQSIVDNAVAWYRAGVKEGMDATDFKGDSREEWNACAAYLAALTDERSSRQ